MTLFIFIAYAEAGHGCPGGEVQCALACDIKWGDTCGGHCEGDTCMCNDC